MVILSTEMLPESQQAAAKAQCWRGLPELASSCGYSNAHDAVHTCHPEKYTAQVVLEPSGS